jgi:hypothetical protein
VYRELRTQLEALGLLLGDKLQEIRIPIVNMKKKMYLSILVAPCMKGREWQKMGTKNAPLSECQHSGFGYCPLWDRARPGMTLCLWTIRAR